MTDLCSDAALLRLLPCLLKWMLRHGNLSRNWVWGLRCGDFPGPDACATGTRGCLGAKGRDSASWHASRFRQPSAVRCSAAWMSLVEQHFAQLVACLVPSAEDGTLSDAQVLRFLELQVGPKR